VKARSRRYRSGLDVVLFLVRLDEGVLDDDQLSPVAGARSLRPLDKFIEAIVDTLTAGFDE